MEEEKNNNKVVDKGKELAKDTAKGAVKKGIWTLIKPALPYIAAAIGIFIVLILALGVINMVVYVVQQMFSSLLTSSSPTQQTPTTVVAEAQSVISLGEHGEYIVNDTFS